MIDFQKLAAEAVARQVRGALDNAVTVGFDGQVSTGNLYAERAAALAREQGRQASFGPPRTPMIVDYNYPQLLVAPRVASPVVVPAADDIPAVAVVEDTVPAILLPPPVISPISDAWFNSNPPPDATNESPAFAEFSQGAGDAGSETQRQDEWRSESSQKAARKKPRAKGRAKGRPRAKASPKKRKKKAGVLTSSRARWRPS